MKQVIKFKNGFFMMVIIIASFFMSIGYASINSVILDIKSTVNITTKKELYISNAVVADENNGTGLVNIYDGKYFSSNTVLTAGDITSTVTYAITFTNNTPYTYGYVGPKYVLGANTYDNENITFDIIGITAGDELAPTESKTFTITFKYLGENTTNNILNSGISFIFKNLSAMKLSTLIQINEGELADSSLYSYNNKQYFVGNNVNNYIWFNCDEGYISGSEHCEKWRIISIEPDESIRIIKDEVVSLDKIAEMETATNFWFNIGGQWLRDSKILSQGKIIFDTKGRRPQNAALENSYCINTYNGCNAYASDQSNVGRYYDLNVDADSLMKIYLETIYYPYAIKPLAKTQIVDHIFPVGIIPVSQNIDSTINYENAITITSNIGLLHPSDYVIISNNDNCKLEFTRYNKTDCVTTNWLPISGKQYHMMNSKFLSLDASRAQIWTVKDDGSIISQDASNEFYLRPVVVLDKNTQAIGLGTTNEDDYYMIIEE